MSFRYVVDTDWVIHYLNGHAQIVTRLQKLADDASACPSSHWPNFMKECSIPAIRRE